MHSMTGFGRGREARQGLTVVAEVSSVNRRQCDVRILLPKEYAVLEGRLRSRLQKRVSRGAYAVTITVSLAAERRLDMSGLDVDAAVAALRKLQEIGARAGLTADVRAVDALAVPGVICEAALGSDTETVGVLAETALDLAMDGLRRTQETEGQALADDLLRRCQLMNDMLAAIRGLADASVALLRDRIVARIRLLGVELAADSERLAKEVAFLAERSDVSEEITRLGSHLDQLCGLCRTDDALGRNLDFLCQELGREINTLCAKAADTELVRHALSFKVELERVREQVQNVE